MSWGTEMAFNFSNFNRPSFIFGGELTPEGEDGLAKLNPRLSTLEIASDVNEIARVWLASPGPLYKGVLMSPERLREQTDPSGPRNHTFVFQYNPATLRVTHEMELGEVDTPGTVLPSTYFVRGKPIRISFTLEMQSKFPDTEAEATFMAEHGLEAHISALQAFTQSSDYLAGRAADIAVRRPPKTIFSLGRRFAVPVWIQKIDIQYLEWRRDMVPSRAAADIDLIVAGVDEVSLAWVRSIGDFANRYNDRSEGVTPIDQRISQ